MKRKLALLFSKIRREVTSQIISLDILIVKNFIPASGFLYKYFLNIIYTIILRMAINKITMKLSRKFMTQK